MFGSFSNFWEEAIVKHVTKIAAYAQPDLFCALSTADPTDSGAGVAEPAGGAYARVAVAAWSWNAGQARAENTGAVNFPAATGAWGTITHFAFFDALAAGNFCAHGALPQAKTVGIGDTIQFPAGQLTIAMD